MKECKNGHCLPIAVWLSVILSVAILIGGAFLGTTIYKKVNTIHKIAVEMQYGSANNFEAIFKARMTPEVLKNIDEEVKKGIQQLTNAPEGGTIDTTGEEKKTGGELSTEDLALLLKGTHTYNDKTSDIVVVEYADILCSACKYLHDNKALKEVSDTTPEASFAFVSVPLWDYSLAGAIGAYCAGEVAGSDGYYKFIDEGFEAKPQDAEATKAIAKKLGLDEATFNACISNPESQTKTNGLFELGRKLFKVNATPTNIVINKTSGKYEIVGGAAPKAMFDDAIAKVK